ncbi:MAG: 30S ribosomal protein S6 [Patescibacteria group bacterium]
MLQKYTLALLLSGTDTDEQNNDVLTNVKDAIQKFNGKIINTEEPYKRRLAFAIKKIRQGTYVNINFEIEKNEVQKLNRELRLINEILRFQTNKYTEIKKTMPVATGKEDDKKRKPFNTKEKEAEKPKQKKTNKKINIEDLNKKLDEILETDSTK